MKKLLVSLVAIVASLVHAQALAQSGDTRAVPTYESVGLYWSNPGANPATGCEVRFRRTGTSAWTQGLAMWLDTRNNECRGSLVYLTPDTDYQVEMNLPGMATARSLAFRTWANQKPVARTVIVPGGASTLNITEGGTASGYVVYQGAPGAVLDANNAVAYNVSVSASYVIVRGFVLRGAQRDAVRISPTVSDVVIEDNEITGWGRQRTGIYGTDLDSAIRAICSTPTLERVTIQRNEIHDPRYTANSWSDGHPQGPQAVTISFCGGNHVIRHNEMFSTTGRYFNDIIGGEDNDSLTGFPNADSDIYGNELSHAWDDAIEAEGGNKNVRVWGNYIDQTGTGIASTMTTVGPLYIFRNVYNRSRILEKTPLDQDDRQVMFKAGSDAALGDGRRYIFHNTTLQAMQAGAIYGLGAAGGISGTGPTHLLNNTVSRNNIFHNWRTWTAYYDVGTGNDFANDMYNGAAGAPDTNGIHATPIYAPGNGWMSEAGGMYQLAPGTPGFDQAARIANFNDAYSGAAPDVGAHEGGTAAMRFGILASSGPAAPPVVPALPARVSPDFNGDGKADILWRSASDAVELWLMNGTTASAQGAILGGGSGYFVKHMADFDGDGKSDILWQSAPGATSMWLMNGLAHVGGADLLGAGTGWTVKHAADFNGDGKTDLLWEHTTNGASSIWLMNGTAYAGGLDLIGPNSGWKVKLIGDFNGDGKKDLLWESAAGATSIWLMNGTTYLGGADLNGPGTGWTVKQLGDFNGDGKTDIIWEHTDGTTTMWLMNGVSVLGAGGLVGPASGYHVKWVADFNGDGNADIVWEHANGSASMWLMSGVSSIGTAGLIGPASGYSIVKVRDLNGDGKADLIWQFTDGSTSAWLMNGTVALGSGNLRPGSQGFVPFP